jgi:hypothetical protein
MRATGQINLSWKFNRDQEANNTPGVGTSLRNYFCKEDEFNYIKLWTIYAQASLKTIKQSATN